MSNASSFPLLLIPILVYNVLVFVNPNPEVNTAVCSDVLGQPVHQMTCALDTTVLQLPMRSKVVLQEGGEEELVHWLLTVGDLLLIFSLLLLFFELLKSTESERSSLLNHGFSFMVFLGALVQFLLYPPFATSVYFLITQMAMLDVLAGFLVTISTARREVPIVNTRA